MKPRITKQHIYGFLFGILFCIIIDAIFNWPDLKTAFMEGYNAATEQNDQDKK